MSNTPIYDEVVIWARRHGVEVENAHFESTYKNMTMELRGGNGELLMSAPVGAPVMNGDMIQFAPIRVSF